MCHNNDDDDEQQQQQLSTENNFEVSMSKEFCFKEFGKNTANISGENLFTKFF